MKRALQKKKKKHGIYFLSSLLYKFIADVCNSNREDENLVQPTLRQFWNNNGGLATREACMEDSRTQENYFQHNIPDSRPKGRPKTEWSDALRKDLREWKRNESSKRSIFIVL